MKVTLLYRFCSRQPEETTKRFLLGDIRSRRSSRRFRRSRHLRCTFVRTCSHPHSNRTRWTTKSRPAHNSTRRTGCPDGARDEQMSDNARRHSKTHIELVVLCRRASGAENSRRSTLERNDDCRVGLVRKLAHVSATLFSRVTLHVLDSTPTT